MASVGSQQRFVTDQDRIDAQTMEIKVQGMAVPSMTSGCDHRLKTGLGREGIVFPFRFVRGSCPQRLRKRWPIAVAPCYTVCNPGSPVTLVHSVSLSQAATVGSGYIQLPPQRRFERPAVFQPPTLAVSGSDYTWQVPCP